MWTVNNSVGKLVDAQISRVSPSEMRDFVQAIASAVEKSSCPVVGILNLSRVRVFAPEDAALLLEVMRRDNPRVERTAIVISSDKLFSMQIERLLQNSGSSSRRLFKTLADAVNWVSEVLDPEETARARQLLR